MVGDRWGVSERWNVAVAALYGALIGVPLQVVQDAITDDRTGMTLVQNPEILLLGVVGGSVVFVVVACIRNRIVLKERG